jgi:hypothetical protein
MPLTMVLPRIFKPVFITNVPPLFATTSEAVLLFRLCTTTLVSSVSVTPLPTSKSDPVVLKLTVRSVVLPARVMPAVFPP